MANFVEVTRGSSGKATLVNKDNITYISESDNSCTIFFNTADGGGADRIGVKENYAQLKLIMLGK